MFTTRRALVTLAAALACSAFAAHAADTVYTAKLDGAQHLPEPIDTKATGQLEMRPSADGKQIAYTISVQGLLNVVAADLHLGPPTANGPLVMKLFPRQGQATKQGEFTGILAQGTVTAADLIGPLTGADLDEFLEALAEGNVYTNVHTSDRMDPPNSGPGDYRLGEIRGQVK